MRSLTLLTLWRNEKNRTIESKAREIAQQFRACAALPEDPRFAPMPGGSHRLELQPHEIECPPLVSEGTHVCGVHAYVRIKSRAHKLGQQNDSTGKGICCQAR